MNTVGDLRILTEYLRSRGMTLSLAESCTGGMLSEIVTSNPGSSEYYLGCAVTYSNEAKENILGVRHDTLVKYGAVSEETAKEMASGARKVFGSTVSAAITGVAGPGGGTDEKPVGLVYVSATDGETFVTSVNRFWGDRTDIRHASASAAVRALMSLLGIENDL